MAIITSKSALESLRFSMTQIRLQNRHTKSGKSVYFASMDVQRHYDKLEQLIVLLDILEEPGFMKVQGMARNRLQELNLLQTSLFETI